MYTLTCRFYFDVMFFVLVAATGAVAIELRFVVFPYYIHAIYYCAQLTYSNRYYKACPAYHLLSAVPTRYLFPKYYIAMNGRFMTVAVAMKLWYKAIMRRHQPLMTMTSMNVYLNIAYPTRDQLTKVGELQTC